MRMLGLDFYCTPLEYEEQGGVKGRVYEKVVGVKQPSEIAVPKTRRRCD
jgi:hypothetical protein